MKQFIYTTKNGYTETIKAQNITELYEKIKGRYIGSVKTKERTGLYNEVVMPKVKR